MFGLPRASSLLLVALLAACGAQVAAEHQAVEVHDGDVCAVCGMYLRDSPGPRGEAWVNGEPKPLVFDSIRDFFAWVLQPEHQHTAGSLYVQNSALIDWRHPTGAAASFIDARRAFYVAWQPLPGSMGATLAPFADRAAADGFVAKHGGAVLTFAQVTPDLVASLDRQCPPAGPGAAPACHAPPAGGTSTPEMDMTTPADAMAPLPAHQVSP